MARGLVSLARGLLSLARVPLVNVLADFVIHVWLLEVVPDNFHDLSCTPVLCYLGVVFSFEDPISEG
jgi:hypothetical protein